MTFEIREEVEKCLKIADEYYGEKIPRPAVRFDLRGTTAGQSNYSKNYLRFNLKLAMENPDYMPILVRHELSHHLDRHFNKYVGTSHSRTWKATMISVYKLPPRVTHSLDTTSVRRKTKTYKYSCGCNDKIHFMGLIRHKKAVRGAVFTCNKCRGEVSFVGRDEKPAAAPNKYLRETQLD